VRCFTAVLVLADRCQRVSVWLKELFNGDKAVILYNNGTQPVNIAVTWQDIGWSNTAAVAIRDLWKRSNVGVFTGGYNATIASHDVLLFRAQLNATIPLL
jgi:alpha-galactosidase